jgi:putative PEP-CTERM system histidine kinase
VTPSLGVVSHAAAGLAFALLALLLATSWQGGTVGKRFIFASAMSAVWAVVAAIDAARSQGLSDAILFSSEMLRDAAWLVALTGLAAGLLPRMLALLAQSICLALLAAIWLVPLRATGMPAAAVARVVMTPAGIASAVIVLLLLEQVYRNANAAGRRGFKYLAVGLGGVYAYDLFLYSQAQLFGGISAQFWEVRGLVNAALVPLIAIAARRNPQWSLDVFVSRQAVLFTTSILAVGVYLLLMAFGGYYLQIVGGRWGMLANLLFVCGAVVVLTIVVTSGSLRRRLRVFVHKHFYRNKYDYRVEWLRFVETLSSGQGKDMQRVSLQAIAQVFESEGAVLYARSGSAPQFEAVAAWPWQPREGAEPRPVPEDHEFVAALRDRRWVIDVREYHDAPEFYQNMELPEALRTLRGYRIIAPLLDANRIFGFVLLREPPPPFDLTYEDRDLLLTLGRHVAVTLAQQESERRLAEVRQFEAYHRLTAFMMHDLKNLVAQLDLVVRNAARHRANQQFVDDAFATVAHAASRMTQLIAQLSRREPAGEARAVRILELAGEVVRNCSDREPAPVLISSLSEEDPATVLAERSRLVSTLEHIIRNAQDASQPMDQLQVAISNTGGHLLIAVRDRGAGMTTEFIRTRLFKPFDSTKGSKGMGIGAYQVQEYIRSLGGDVEVQSSPGAGTCFTIKLPRHE